MSPVAIGFATTGATLLITVILFAVDRILSRRDQRQEVRRQLMTRVLDTFELSTRSLVRPALVQLWTNSDLEYALLLPRLLLDLGDKDRVIAAWVQRQVQVMQLEPSKRKALAIRTSVGEKLLRWHHGELPRTWFEAEVQRDPARQGFTVPKTIKIRRVFYDSWEWVQLLGTSIAVGLAFRKIFRA